MRVPNIFRSQRVFIESHHFGNKQNFSGMFMKNMKIYFSCTLAVIEMFSCQVTVDTSLLPRGEELHATLCLGMVEDQVSLAQEAAEVFHLDHELQPEEGDTGRYYTDYTPVFLFLWRSKMSLFLRSKQLLCETYQGRAANNHLHTFLDPCRVCDLCRQHRHHGAGAVPGRSPGD